MIRTLAYAIIVGIAVFSIAYALFIVGNDLLYNSDDGLIEVLNESAQQDMDGDYLTRWNSNMENDKQMFGLTMVLIGAVVIICISIIAFEKRPRSPRQ